MRRINLCSGLTPVQKYRTLIVYILIELYVPGQTDRQTRLSGNSEILLQSTDNLLHYKIASVHLLH